MLDGVPQATRLSFPGARDHEIDAHCKSVLETGTSIQAAILANVIVAFEDLATFSRVTGESTAEKEIG